MSAARYKESLAHSLTDALTLGSFKGMREKCRTPIWDRTPISYSLYLQLIVMNSPPPTQRSRSRSPGKSPKKLSMKKKSPRPNPVFPFLLTQVCIPTDKA